MALRNSKPITFRAKGLSDTRDSTNTFAGAMQALQNYIPSPDTADLWVPRPAALGLTGSGSNPTRWDAFVWGGAAWGGFDNIAGAAQINALLVVGNWVYGMIASTLGTFAGLDYPFAYNLATQTFASISVPGGVASLPTTPATSGDWTPPIMAVIGSRIVLTHPGFSGGANPFFGWLDISSFSDATKTGNTHTSTLIDTLSANVLTAGWQPGMLIIGTGIPADTTIVSIAANGLSLTLSQAATSTNVGVALTVTGGTQAAPLWSSGNTNGSALAKVPVAVFNFNGRAWFAVPGHGTVFSDAGNATQVTNATQALTPNNGLDITAFGGLPFTQSQGGILQALIAFQGDAQMLQITGDITASTLAMNELGIGVGTLAPNTICQTPMGLTFVAPDGVRYIDFIGRVSEPLGFAGKGVLVPFLNAINPSRMCAAYNQDVMRITVQNGNAVGQPVQEYWYHVSRKVWSGPHTFPAALIEAFQGSPDHGFVVAAFDIDAELWSSEVTPTVTSSYTENGMPMTAIFQTSLLPDNQDFAENRVNETLLGASLPAGSVLAVAALNENGVILDSVLVNGPAANPTIWGTFLWGAAPWSAPLDSYQQNDVPWPQPLIFKQVSISITATSLAGMAIGNLYFRYQALGYRMQAMAKTSGGLR